LWVVLFWCVLGWLGGGGGGGGWWGGWGGKKKRKKRTIVGKKWAPPVPLLPSSDPRGGPNPNRSRPPNTALLISAPAMPCVMVFHCVLVVSALNHHQELGMSFGTTRPIRLASHHDAPDSSAPLSHVRGERDQKPARRCGSKSRRAILFLHVCCEDNAVA